LRKSRCHTGRGEDDVPARHLLEREDLVHVGDAHLLRALDLLSLRGLRRPCMSPPIQRTAAAAITPSGAAADAHQDATPVSGKQVEIARSRRRRRSA